MKFPKINKNLQEYYIRKLNVLCNVYCADLLKQNRFLLNFCEQLLLNRRSNRIYFPTYFNVFESNFYQYMIMLAESPKTELII